MEEESKFMRKLASIKQMADCPVTFTVGYRGKWELLDVKFYPGSSKADEEPEADMDYVG
jgi:hypothetical protein